MSSSSSSLSSSSLHTPGASFATDHFSGATEHYRTFRPSYPEELFQYLYSLVNKEQGEGKKDSNNNNNDNNDNKKAFIAIDAGTGNGQAAVSLGKYFDRVYAFDPSQSLIEQAIHADGVHYFVAGAENFLNPLQSLHSSIIDQSKSSSSSSTFPSLPSSLLNNVSLIISATAAHWFDLPLFYRSVDSLLSINNGILAIFSYGYHMISSNNIAEEISKEFSQITLLSYWPSQIHYIHNNYKTIPFPIDYEKSFNNKYGNNNNNNNNLPLFFIRTDMTAYELIGYMYTWSGTRRFLDGSNNEEEKNKNKLIWEKIKERLINVWKKDDDGKEGMGKEIIVLPIHIRIGLKGEHDDINKLGEKK